VEIALGVGIGIIVATGIFVAGRNGWLGTGGRGDVGELEEAVISLQRSVKLLQGRMNTYAPPRLGTGENVDAGAKGDSEEPVPRATVRQLILRAYRDQMKQRGGRR